MPKNREVASLVGNLSPVKRRSAILVRSMRHLRGDTGEELNNRAATWYQRGLVVHWALQTLLKDRCSVHLDNGLFGIFVLLPVIHLESGDQRIELRLVCSHWSSEGRRGFCSVRSGFVRIGS